MTEVRVINKAGEVSKIYAALNIQIGCKFRSLQAAYTAIAVCRYMIGHANKLFKQLVFAIEP